MPNIARATMPTLKDRLTGLARDKNGNIVLGEAPNLPIKVALIATVLSFTVSIAWPVGLFFIILAFGAWFTWAWLEIFRGTNTLRRIMGSGVMVLLLTTAYVGLALSVR